MKDKSKYYEENGEKNLQECESCFSEKCFPMRETVRKSRFGGLPGLPNGKYLLNANENPYDVFMFPEVRQEFMQLLEKTVSNRYPDPAANELRQKMAEYLGVEKDCIIAGNGGDEMISLAINTFLNPGDKLLLHEPTFVLYKLNAGILGADVISVPDLENFTFDRQGFKAAVQACNPQLTVICNPNNPTASVLPASYIEKILQLTDGIVLVDEAYIEFAEYEGGESVVPLVKKYPNLVVLRTLSKAFGLAGYRIGYAVANSSVIKALMKVKAVFNLNSISQNMGIAALKHSDLILGHHVPAVLKAKKKLAEKLQKIPGIKVYPSSTNFILIEAKGLLSAAEINSHLKKAGVCISSYPQGSVLENCLRISVGDPEAMKILVEVMEKYCR